MAQLKVYIAGPMRGYPQFNFPAFDAAATMLRAAGFVVVSPADIDRAHGFDGTGSIPDGAFPVMARACILRDAAAICDGCTHLYVLPGWEHSRGTRVELALAEFLGLEVMYA
jgi:hypothetical protein